jgi:ADP-heptose:LPS heptosyltransferase
MKSSIANPGKGRGVAVGLRRVASRLVRPVRRLVGATCLAYARGAGIGDHIMLSAVARELKRRGHRRVFVFTEYPELFRHNADVDVATTPGSRRGWLYIRFAERHSMWLTYLIDYDLITEERVPPPDPALAYLCRAVGITGRVDLRPYITLSQAERDSGAPYRGCIAVQSTAGGARSRSLNKEWYPDRFAEVAAHLGRSHPVVQVGSRTDPPLPCAHDLRGRTSLRQLASILSHCRMYVGLEGMPMHMARAVDCPSVIVYGGRLRPDQIGYSCNENLYNPVACAPCWLDSRCDFGRVCMETIAARDVIEAAERLLARPRDGLAVDSYEITGGLAGPTRAIRTTPVADRSPAAAALPPPEGRSTGPRDAFAKKLAEGLLSFNLAGAIRLARFGPRDAGTRLATAYRQIDPLGSGEEANGAPDDEVRTVLAHIPEVELPAILRGRPLVKVDVTQQPVDGAMATCDALALLALLVDRAPRTVLEIGTSGGHTTRLLALNLPSAAIHTIERTEDHDAGSDPAPRAKDDFHPTTTPRVGAEYRSDPSITNVVQHFGDTADWDFRIAEGATFYLIGPHHHPTQVSTDTRWVMAAARGRDVTIVWRDCDDHHPVTVNWLTGLVMAGYPVRRIAGTHLAVMDVSA